MVGRHHALLLAGVVHLGGSEFANVVADPHANIVRRLSDTPPPTRFGVAPHVEGLIQADTPYAHDAGEQQTLGPELNYLVIL